MEEILKHFPTFAPAAGLVGTCCDAPHLDELRLADPKTYVDWVLSEAGEQALSQTENLISSAWKRSAGPPQEYVWTTSVEFERVAARVRRAADLLAGSAAAEAREPTAEDAIEARAHLQKAAEVAKDWDMDEDFFRRVPEARGDELDKLAHFATCVAHTRAIATLTSVETAAGLWRSLADLAGRNLDAEFQPDDVVSPADACLFMLREWSNIQAARLSAQVLYDAGRADAALACAERAAAIAQEAHVTQRSTCAGAPFAFPSSAVVAEVFAFRERVAYVAQRVTTTTGLLSAIGVGGRGSGNKVVFTSKLLAQIIALPEI